jgi:hypothetical protein
MKDFSKTSWIIFIAGRVNEKTIKIVQQRANRATESSNHVPLLSLAKLRY